MAGQRLPTNLKILQGTIQNCRENKLEPKLKTGIPPMPENMSAYAQEKWPRFCQVLHDMNVLTEADAEVVQTLCESYSAWRTYREKVAALPDGGIVYGKDGMPRIHPFVHAFELADAAYMKWLGKCGLTPVDRSRLKINETSTKSDFGDL